jgi:hypothetical protein
MTDLSKFYNKLLWFAWINGKNRLTVIKNSIPYTIDERKSDMMLTIYKLIGDR